MGGMLGTAAVASCELVEIMKSLEMNGYGMNLADRDKCQNCSINMSCEHNGKR